MRSALFLLLAAFAFAACGPGAGEPDGTPTPEPTPADHAAIRDLDLESLADTETLLQQLGSGRVAGESVIYRDLTGDGREEAVVPITSEGTLGNIAYLVYTLEGGSAQVILTRTMDRTTASGLVMEIGEGGALTETVGVFGPEDPLCCPGSLRLTSFRWDGRSLQVESEVTRQQPPNAKQ